ncbi:MAG: DUF3318 domain-containing protein [Oscillatoriales cyanobacterium SM2_1_8]|nr:DUF3318 domain-containing protein [Oscillatoriales cyanobacterium SM2_1_8]
MPENLGQFFSGSLDFGGGEGMREKSWEDTSPSQEVARLLDLLPASWRMETQVSPRAEQPAAIASTPLSPWQRTCRVSLNFKKWVQFSPVQRELLFLREVAWRQQTKWLQVGPLQGVLCFGALVVAVESTQMDLTGVAGGVLLALVAGNQLWRRQRSVATEFAADQEAIAVARKRGYTETAAAQALLAAVDGGWRLEGRRAPSFTEATRMQALRAMVGGETSPIATATVWE